MTQQFLEALPEISLGELPSESTCMICLNAYGTSSPDNGSVAENPVRLPCNHHVGSDCISTWLSPSKTAQNSCPYCRAKFFPAQPRPYMEHGLMDDDEGAHTAAPGNPMVEMTSRIGRIGRPVRAPEDRDEWDDDDDEEEEEEQIWAERDSQSMYAHFFQRTPEQYEESLERARAITTEAWGSEPELSADTDEFELEVADLATSFRTLPFREVLLYIDLTGRSSARLPRLSDPVGDLNQEQSLGLFLELERRGAFAEDEARIAYAGLSNLEKWRMHRERDGEVWDLQVGGWSSFGAD